MASVMRPSGNLQRRGEPVKSRSSASHVEQKRAAGRGGGAGVRGCGTCAAGGSPPHEIVHRDVAIGPVQLDGRLRVHGGSGKSSGGSGKG